MLVVQRFNVRAVVALNYFSLPRMLSIGLRIVRHCAYPLETQAHSLMLPVPNERIASSKV